MKLSRLALAAALLPGAAIADDSASPAERALKLPDQIVTSARQAEPRAQATSANTVFTRDDIERLQARSVPELLQRVPGVQVSTAGGVPSYSLRGTNTAQTLVLVDGQRIASASSGIARIDYLNIDNIERVEVTRGPRSALYGADAIGGVIQIFTRRGESGLHPELRLAAGSHGTFQRSAALAGGDARTRFNLGASLDETQGWDLTRDGRGADSDHDGQRNKAMHLNLDHQLNDAWKAGFSLNDQHGDSEYDDAYSYAPGQPHDEFRVSSYSGYLEGQLGERWNSRLELGHSYDRNKAVGAAEDWNNGTLETTRHSASWINRLQLDPRNQLALGADWYQDRVDGSTEFAEDSRENHAFFAQHSFKGEAFATELGLRHDDNQRYGTQNSWNAALTLPVDERQSWILSYGEGFRAPTFSDLYYPGAGNPDLKAETAKTYELQWRGDFAGNHLEAAAYRTEVNDLIAWDSASNQPENIAKARIDGIEASIGRELYGWQGNLGLSLIDPRDRDTGHTLPRRARRTLSLDLDRQFGAFGLGGSWRALSNSYADAANDNRLGGYGVLDLRGSWAFSDSLRWDLKLQNLFDRDYAQATYERPTDPSGYPTTTYAYREAGRTALLALTWTPEL
ncbi:TonB-dependent receptor domain-containing protein [Pseudomonas panipatensis]|uniref:Vitamin B12 transporter n=1 Tax=Pseudomonas panipatensis TaxID=428992 RepID=A0A1G8EF70_9PSED|nr:TonB-dependent receptor [Pseudomonas panipatensis]SDH68534.1 vitamin B12 transporter [Pseudomonas panipatensis]SMP67739.1 vitamin B12 transporter [Pseudomonas panipatensis]